MACYRGRPDRSKIPPRNPANAAGNATRANSCGSRLSGAAIDVQPISTGAATQSLTHTGRRSWCAQAAAATANTEPKRTMARPAPASGGSGAMMKKEVRYSPRTVRTIDEAATAAHSNSLTSGGG